MPYASFSALAVSSAAKTKSLLISSFLASETCHLRLITRPITGTARQTTKRTRLENPRSSVTRIYPAPHTHPAPITHLKQLSRGPHIDWSNSCTENPEKASTKPQGLDSVRNTRQPVTVRFTRKVESMYVDRSPKQSGFSTGN